MEFNVVQLIQLFLNLGGIATFAVLFWRHIVKQEETFIDRFERLEGHHRAEMIALEERHVKERAQREQDYHNLMERTIETVTEIKTLLITLSRHYETS